VILSGVTFPERLLDAIEASKLVVFAGAGVSMGEPAKLPSFWELATKIAKGTGEEPRLLGNDGNGKEIWEPLDQFFGRLSLDELSLQKRVAARIETGSPHTELHSSLVNLFGACDQVRVVTTNFDLLFESACETLWGLKPITYTAPALPLGSRFHGVVHVHGAVKHVESIVLTDSDFGRAYLTEGWARRFLVELFEHYTVLFVGYSHDDTVLQYLARALPDKARNKRFAMVGVEEAPEKWGLLGIEPIQFQKVNKDDFSVLYSAASELADFANRPPSDWQEKIGAIASNPPSAISIEDEECIRHALKDVSKVRYFCRKAQSAEWVVWLDDEKTLMELFESDTPDKKTQVLGEWLVEHFAEQEPDRIFQLIGKHWQHVGLWFWWSLTRKIGLSEGDHFFGKWLDVLMQTKPHYVDIHALQWLAEKSQSLGMFDRTLRVFESMAETRVIFREPYRSSGDKPYQIRRELEIQSSEWNLNEVWTKCLSPHLDTQYSKVLDVCRSLLLRRHGLACNWSGASGDRDWDSLRRSAIEPHEEDEYPEAIDVVINAARAAVEKMAADVPRQTQSWIWNHHSSPSQLLQRLAIHCIGFLKDQSADERLLLLLEKGLHNEVYRQEAFSLLQAHYAQASPAIKEQVVDAILAYQSTDPEEPQRQSAVEHLQWLSVLQAADPGCAFIGSEIAKIEGVYQGLSVQPYPGLSSETDDGWSGYESPWSVEDLLGKNSREWFEQLLAFEGGGFRGPSRSGLCSTLSEAAKQRPDWAFKLCEYLEHKGVWESDFWSPLFRGLGVWPEAREEVEPLLQLINTEQLASRYQREIADILCAAVKSGGVRYVCDILPETNSLAISLWNSIELSTDPIDSDDSDWLNSAINTTGGTLAEYWIYALDASNHCHGKELREPYRTELSRLSASDDPKTRFSIPVITQQVSFLLSLDQRWTEETIKPLFSAEDNDRASQAWHGFLGCRGPTEQVFKSLRSEFQDALPRLDTILQNKEDRFIGFYIAVAFWYVDNPNEDWIPRLLNSVADENRPVLARKMEGILRNMGVESRVKAWSQWLEDYWKNRIAGSPKPFTEAESRAMLNWPLHLGENYPSGVDLAVQMARPRLEQGGIIYQLYRSGLGEKYPEDTARLLTYMLDCPAEHFAFYGIEELLGTLSNQEINEPVKKDLNEALIRNGYNPI